MKVIITNINTWLRFTYMLALILKSVLVERDMVLHFIVHSILTISGKTNEHKFVKDKISLLLLHSVLSSF